MSSITIIADGSTRFFAFPFAIFSAAELEVRVDGAVVTEGIDITGEGASDGGHVTFATAPVANTSVTLRRLGKVEVSDQDVPGFLEDKLTAGTNIAIAKTAVSGGEALVISTTIDGDDYLRKDQNLADLPDTAAARNSLGLGSAAILDAGTGASDLVQLDAQGRLPAVDGSQLTDIPFGRVKVADTDAVADFLDVKLAAGDNVTLTAVTGTSGQALEIAAATDPAVDAQFAALSEQVSNLIWNQGVLALRSQIGAGWSVLKMVDGWADEFEDESGVDSAASVNASYDAAGDCYDNRQPGTYGLNLIDGTQAYAASSTNGSHIPAKAADGDDSSFWEATVSATTHYWAIDFSAGGAKRLTKVEFHIASGQTYSADVHVEGSNDNINWEPLTNLGSGFANYAAYSLTFQNASSYRHYRLRFTYSSANNPSLYEVRAYEDVAAVQMTLVSNTVLPAQSAPAEARLLLLHEPVDAVTVNTDLVAEVSRDGGTTWSAATLADEGPFDGSTRILAGIADLSGQPAGTAMKWRVRTLNAKSQRLHGVWVQWR